MGLDVTVGALIGLEALDAEGFAYRQGEFARLNRALEAAGLPPHAEPTEPCGMIGSAPMLMEECARLAAALELPLDLEPDAARVRDAASSADGAPAAAFWPAGAGCSPMSRRGPLDRPAARVLT